MSAFLGQIHFWLYKKIQLLVEREKLILEKTNNVVGDLADELHQVAIDTYGQPIDPEIPLDQLIDHDNIHGWLSSQIQRASVREAAFIKDLLDCVSGDQSVPTIAGILDAFAMQGKACGILAKESLTEESGEAIYNALQNFYVNGMPCDGGDQIIDINPQHFQWIGDHHLQIPYWRTAGIDPNFMALSYQTWFEFFTKHISDSFEFLVEKKDGQQIYTIQAK